MCVTVCVCVCVRPCQLYNRILRSAAMRPYRISLVYGTFDISKPTSIASAVAHGSPQGLRLGLALGISTHHRPHEQQTSSRAVGGVSVRTPRGVQTWLSPPAH